MAAANVARAYAAAASLSGLTRSSEIVWRSMTSKAVRCVVVQQSVMHAPEHQLLHRPDTQFLLNAVDGVPGRHRLNPPRLRYPSVGHTLGEGDEYLPAPLESARPPLQHLRSRRRRVTP